MRILERALLWLFWNWILKTRDDDDDIYADCDFDDNVFVRKDGNDSHESEYHIDEDDIYEGID